MDALLGFPAPNLQRSRSSRRRRHGPPVTRTVELVYFNAGGGHRAACAALAQAISMSGRPLRVRATDLIEVLDPGAKFKRLTGMAPEDYYNKRLATGLTIGLGQELKILQGTIRLGHCFLSRRLVTHWQRSEPDLVVSLIPNFNRAMCESLAISLPRVPFSTVMTDLTDSPPNFWMVRGLPQHLVCGTAQAVRQAQRLGFDARHVHRVSGMVLRPDFHEPRQLDRRAARQALGLDPDRPTGLVLFGGHGSRAMRTIAQDLADVQLVFMCGHNMALARKLQALPRAAPRAVVGFTPDVRHYMHLSDFFIGKPGPGCLSEAVHMGLPIATVRNAWTMPQERFNTDWVRENGLGVVAASMGGLRAPVLSMVDRLEDFQAQSTSGSQKSGVVRGPGHSCRPPRPLASVWPGHPADRRRTFVAHRNCVEREAPHSAGGAARSASGLLGIHPMSRFHSFAPQPGERFNTWTHLFGLAVATVLGLQLVETCATKCDRTSTAGIAVFVAAAVGLFGASVLCHASNSHRQQLWERLDHAATFLLIAGSYTPFATVQPRQDANVVILAGIWLVALVLAAQQLLGHSRQPPLLAYVALGWFGILAAAPAAIRLGDDALRLLLEGAVMYSIGTVFYRNKTGWAYAHGTWHLFVVAGLTAHAVAISRLVLH